MLQLIIKVNIQTDFFTYKSPVDIRPGDLVTVPFGSGDREKKAIVCGTPTKIDCPSDKLKTISEVVERGFLSEEAVKTAVWMKQRYGIKYHDAFRCFVPTGKAPKAGKEKEPYKDVSGKYVRPEASRRSRFSCQRNRSAR